MASKGDKELSVTKKDNFSEWYSEIIQKAELADLRYNVKGFLVFQPWSVRAMEHIYQHLERVLQEKGHEPYWYPTLIPEGNLKKESQHLKGFTPEVFWVTQGGEGTFDEKLALRPTSETAFYQMFALWLRSYKQLPMKTYQRAQVFRYETKATRPFLRSREFHWIETHCLFENMEKAMHQVHEDMDTTTKVLHDVLGLPFIFFERPSWDKFPGAHRTFAADVLNPDGKLVQQPSTHLIKQDFLKAFDVKYKDRDGSEKTPWSTCYGPAVSRILASVVIVHGDDKGLRFPWDVAPLQVVIVPVTMDEKVAEKINHIESKIKKLGFSVKTDYTDKSAGEKFNYWEMKGVPVRIDIGPKDLKEKSVTIFRRDTGKKITIREDSLVDELNRISHEFTANLTKEADKLFDDRIESANDIKKLKKVIEKGCIARCGFCSVDSDGARCAEKVEKETGAQVRGIKFGEDIPVSGKCVVCGKKAKVMVYIGRSY
jgi:prolyl-tRNA synthetase